jgi:acetyl-CoA C-acetyltransferase
MSKVYIVSAKRSATGSFLGTLKNMSAGDLGALVLKSILEETKIDPSDIDEVIMGNILPAGQGQGVARQVSIKAGVPVSVPAYSLNMACGSGMKALMNAYTSIKSGMHHLVVAGGVEIMSGSPYLLPKEVRSGHKMGNINMIDHMIYDALTDAFDGTHMGVTAENIAARYNISRFEQEQFAYNSQLKAIRAVDNDVFKNEIVPILVKVGRDEVRFEKDEYPNRKTDLDKLASLKPAFKKDGVVTAGTASGLNDGASITLIASEEMVKKYNLKPLAEVLAIGQGGVEPNVMGLGPTPAIRQALKHGNISLNDIDVFELNEAFAAQSLGVVHELSVEHNVSKEEIMRKTNPNGGAIALGHPVGASGNRILVTLVHELHALDKNIGCASLCIGGGMGTAVIIKKV